jgi:hypothetical protein
MKSNTVRISQFIIVVSLCLLPTVASAQQDGRGTYLVFPQFADGVFSDGTYYKSTIIASNPSLTTGANCQFTLRAQSSGGVGVTVPYTFGASVWRVNPTSGTAPFVSGYGTMACDNPINAVLLYSFYSATRQKIGEASVFPSVPGKVTQIIADQSEGAKLGVAIANDTSSKQTATVSVINAAGVVVASKISDVEPHSNLTAFLEYLAGYSQPDLAQVLISCTTQCSTIGLRYSVSVFTTIPSSVIIP